jgi:hypothetical protein
MAIPTTVGYATSLHLTNQADPLRPAQVRAASDPYVAGRARCRDHSGGHGLGVQGRGPGNERIAAARDRMVATGDNWGRPNRMTSTKLRQTQRHEGRRIREIAVALKILRSTRQRTLSRSPQP